MTKRKYYTIEDIECANKNFGFHFFDKETLRFFGSRILYPTYNGPGGVFFVTSEKRPYSDDPRRYTVRQFNPKTRGMETAGEFQGFANAKTAKRWAEKLAKGEAK